MANANKLSASHIRYLLVMKKLGESGSGIRSVELASELGVSRPSVHDMLRTLSEMELVRKEPHSAVYLTQAGINAAERYYRYFDALLAVLEQYIPEESIAPEALCSLLAGIPEESLEKLRAKLNGRDVTEVSHC